MHADFENTVPFESLAWMWAQGRVAPELSIVEAASLRRHALSSNGSLVEFDREGGDSTALLTSSIKRQVVLSFGPDCEVKDDVDRFLNDQELRSAVRICIDREWSDLDAQTGLVLMRAGGEYREMLNRLLRVWRKLENTAEWIPVICVIAPDPPRDGDVVPDGEETEADVWELLCKRMVNYGIADLFAREGRLCFFHKKKEFLSGLYLKAAAHAAEQEREAEAERLYREVLELDEKCAEGCHEFGRLLVSQQRHEEAEEVLRKAVGLKESHHYLNTLSLTLMSQGRELEAIPYLQRACEIAPDYHHAANTLGWAYDETGRHAEAIIKFRQAIASCPDYTPAQHNLSRALLANGELAEGWDQFEWRWKLKNFPTRRRDYDLPLWDGSPLDGKSLLLWSEQGIGDQMLFGSMIQDVVNMGATGVIEVGEKLVSIFQRSFPEFDVFFKAPDPHPLIAGRHFDFVAPFGSLAKYLRSSLDQFPKTAGYLKPDPAAVAFWKERVDALDDNFKVGIAWRSSNIKGGRGKHYFSLEELEPILKVPGCTFVCVQYGDAWGEIAETNRKLGTKIVKLEGLDLFDDIDSIIAMTQSLDAGVSTKYSSCLDMMTMNDVPVLTFNRGFNERNLGVKAVPWYSSAEVFHCETGDDPQPVLESMASRLTEMVELHRAQQQSGNQETKSLVANL